MNWSGNGQTWKVVGSGRRTLASRGLEPALDVGEGWRVMANVSLPLFQGGRRLAQGAAERARLHELRQDRNETRNLIELEVVEAFYALKSRRENTQLLRRRADVARQRLDTVEELFENAMGQPQLRRPPPPAGGCQRRRAELFHRAFGLHLRG